MNTTTELLLQLAKEKNISEKELHIALAAFSSAAFLQSFEEMGVDVTKLPDGTMEKLTQQLESVQSKEDILVFNASIDELFSKKDMSLLATYQKLLDGMIAAFIEKIKQL